MHPDRLEPTTANLRERAIHDRQQQITASQEIYRRLLSEVSWAIQSIRQLGELGSGLTPPPSQPPISSEQEARLREFAEKITTGGHSPHDLDLAPLQHHNPPDPSVISLSKHVATVGGVVSRHSDAMDVDVTAQSPNQDQTADRIAATPQVKHPEQSSSNHGHVDTQRSLRQRSTESLLTSHSHPAPNPQPGPSQKSRTESSDLLPPYIKSHFSCQSSSAANPPALAASTNKPPITRASSLPSESSTQPHKPLCFTSHDYASQLPPVPVQILASRLSAAQAVTGTSSKNIKRQAIRSGLWIGPSSSEITKLGIKAQHIGVKSALRRCSPTKSKAPHDNKPKLHNILTTADWKTMIDELQMTRALEVLERLKAEKAWAYSQIKKPRIPPVQKAHWDHLLDEMAWLQVDFRQERRWKIATAHRLAKQVVRWHQADSLGKRGLQVKVYSPEKYNKPGINESFDGDTTSCLAPPHQIAPSSTSRSIHLTRLSSEMTHMELASPSLSTRGSPESFRSVYPLRSPIPAETTAIPIVEKLPPTATPETHYASPQESRKTLQQIKRSRIPIFEMTPDETLIDIKKLMLDGICAKPTGYTIEHVKLQKLFVDLPLFGDLDSRPDKRPDEASPHLGRIARIAPFLEAKPLLVSTLQPSKNCLGRQWRNLGPLSADDLRDSGDHKSDPSHHHNYIFSGRKSKESKESNASAPPTFSVPDPEPSDERTWSSTDEELLKQIASTYEFNWKIVADVFNASLSQSMNVPITPRACYDCWTRLQPSRSIFESNPAASVAPVSATQSNAEIPSVESNQGTHAAKRPAEAALFPNKRITRDDALQEIARRLKERRSCESQRLVPSPRQPRQILLSAHETHAQTMRPYMTPLEMSALKAERDRQAQAQFEMAKRQQQMHQESLLHQARAAAMVAAAAQMPMRNASNKVSPSVNGSLPSRVHSQPTAVSLVPGRQNGPPGVTIHRQASQVPARYATSPPLLNVSSRGTGSPVSHPPTACHQTRQALLENQASSSAPVSSQAPILPQIPNMPQGFQPKTPNSQSPAPDTPNGTTPTPNGLHNNTVSHSLTPIQVAQYLQQQQHLQQLRSPEHRLHQQHQQLLLAQHFQQQGQHPSSPFSHPASSQILGHQSPPHPHQPAPLSNGQSQLSSGAASTANSTPPLAASSSPLPNPPA
ncbi:hypothetical protein PCANC_11899 [Puccinia coronata f. sp. avenae]|uniref:HSA domain-containing protein n=1 Tax=Puccinia coronata f. sp. avenae TaxID=200324 RepID=A0A2N5V5Y6_9BASI|nr:hypothetical protein PCANC_11899 [Puccinia coronata f. sp. avenae]